MVKMVTEKNKLSITVAKPIANESFICNQQD